MSLAVDYVVTVTDAGSPVLSSSTSLRIVIADVDDNSPAFAVAHYEFEVPENHPPGFRVGAVVAVDADDPPFNRVVYRLSTDDARGIFDVDRNSGVIVTATELDREQVTYRCNRLIVVCTTRSCSDLHDKQKQIHIRVS